MGEGEDDPRAGEVKESGMDSSGGRGRNRAYIVALSDYEYASVRDEVEKSGFDCMVSRPTSLGKIRELLQRLDSGQKEKE
jgi:PHD/YefM family antitoxin component YafN of YafNO toxin-antitoxin module